MFQAKVEDDEVTHRDWQGGMSVTEKMRMWASKPDDLDTTLVDVSECFQGVEEDVDERTSDPELPTLGRAILQSKAYEWLIQHLVKESSFCWGQGPRIMVDEIRSAILRGLPAGRISKNRDPDIHRAEFRMPLPQFSQRLLRDYQRTGNAWNWKDVYGAVVLVSSSDDCIVATRVEEYIGQTWSKDMELLTKFRVALKQALSDNDVVVGKWNDLLVTYPLRRVAEFDKAALMLKDRHASNLQCVCRRRLIFHRGAGRTTGLATHRSPKSGEPRNKFQQSLNCQEGCQYLGNSGRADTWFRQQGRLVRVEKARLARKRQSHGAVHCPWISDHLSPIVIVPQRR